MAPDYPWYTPYQFAGNKPIRYIDLDGLEEYDPMFDLNNPMLNPYWTADLLYTFGTDIADGAYNLLEDFKDSFLRSDEHRANNILMADPSLLGKYSNEELVKNFETNYSFKGYGKRKGYYVDTRDGYIAETGETILNIVDVGNIYTGGTGPVIFSKFPSFFRGTLHDIGAKASELAVIKRFNNAGRPLASGYTAWSPYNYVMGNPISNIDPDGRSVESTIVESTGNGTYTVVAAWDDGDTGVYINDGNFGTTGQKIGDSVSPLSFINEGVPVIGAEIDLNSKDGQGFLNGLFNDNPGLIEYANNAKGFEIYDFKKECLDVSCSEEQQIRHQYRGSVLDNGIIASARDVGNIGAGYVAGRQGLGWGEFRLAADRLETKQKTGNYFGIVNRGPKHVYGRMPLTYNAKGIEFYFEAEGSQAAQRYGYREALKINFPWSNSLPFTP